MSTAIPLLLVGRALQGVALLTFPMIAGIVNDEFTVTRRKVAVSLLSAALFFGTGAGGVIAGTGPGCAAETGPWSVAKPPPRRALAAET